MKIKLSANVATEERSIIFNMREPSPYHAIRREVEVKNAAELVDAVNAFKKDADAVAPGKPAYVSFGPANLPGQHDKKSRKFPGYDAAAESIGSFINC